MLWGWQGEGMDQRETLVGDDAGKSTLDLDQVRAADQFGTIGYDAYVAMVLAESNRLFSARSSVE